MNRMLHHTSVVLIVSLFSMLLAVVTVDRSRVSAADAGPTLTDVSVLASSPGTISVTGATFTPGGAVYIALYDPWGAALHETRWITASQTVYGRPARSGLCRPASASQVPSLVRSSRYAWARRSGGQSLPA